MTIWIDADSCPRQVREVIVRAACRTGTRAVFVANKPVALPASPLIGFFQCPVGQDAADNHIVECSSPGDLAITRDVPLASRLVEKGITTLNDRGTVYTVENIREKLSTRNFLVSLAADGLQSERTGSYGPKDLKGFADRFDRELQKLLRATTRP